MFHHQVKKIKTQLLELLDLVKSNFVFLKLKGKIFILKNNFIQ